MGIKHLIILIILVSFNFAINNNNSILEPFTNNNNNYDRNYTGFIRKISGFS